MEKLKEILNYYQKTWQVNEDINDVYNELIENNVEVKGNSFYCPMWKDDIGAYVLLAGTKEKADTWVLKKIINLIKGGKPILSILNGNSINIMKVLRKYNVKEINRDNEIVLIGFNLRGTQWQ